MMEHPHQGVVDILPSGTIFHRPMNYAYPRKVDQQIQLRGLVTGLALSTFIETRLA